jgi:hypothetical protein
MLEPQRIKSEESNMKLKKLSAACALAALAISGQAFGQAAFDTPDVKITLSGATAPDNFLVTIATGLFEPGFHRYQDDNGTVANFADDGRGWNAFFGTMKSTSDIPASLQGKTVMMVKRSRGGSVWGVNPVARAQRVATIKLAALDCVLDSSIYRCPIIGTDPGLPGYPVVGDGAETPDFGVSDVEPAMFKGPYNVEFGQSQLADNEVANLAVKAVNVLMMGMVATASVPATTYLSRAGYAAMLTGNIQDWSQIDPTLATGYTNVVVCRRVQGSGTQTSYNWFFNNFPCQGSFGGTVPPARMLDNSAGVDLGHAGTVADPFLIDPTAGYTVVENSGSGNVRDCLARAQSNSDHQITGDDGKIYKVLFSNGAPGSTSGADPGKGPFRAMGVLSTDSFASATVGTVGVPPTTGWSFRPIDGAGIFDARNTGATAQIFTNGPGSGIPPSKANLLTGKYDFAVELTMQYRNATVVNDHGDSVPALTGLKQVFADLFIARAGDPAFNTGPVTAALLPTYFPSFDPNGIPNNNVAVGTRFGNTCSPLQKLL